MKRIVLQVLTMVFAACLIPGCAETPSTTAEPN